MSEDSAGSTTPTGPAAPRRKPKQTSTRGRNVAATRLLLAITLFGVMLFGITGALAGWYLWSASGGDVRDGSTLVIRLKGPIADAPVVGSIFDDPSDRPPVATEIADAIRAAATDDRITSIYLELNGASAGWGTLAEIRSSIAVFRAAGKPCAAYGEMYDDGPYYLASACDHVLLAPGGITMVSGIAANLTYFRGLFDKLGVEPEFEHVGDFKSAVEPYERTEPSEPASEAMNLLLDGLFDHMVAEMASGRGVPDEQMRAMIDGASMSPRAAVENGLVDALVFRDAVEARLSGMTADDWRSTLLEPPTQDELDAAKKSSTSIKEYVKARRKARSSASAKVAVVHAEGTIVSGRSEGGLFGNSGVLADRDFAEWMHKARIDKAVKAVVIRVNSPGGSGLASDMMWREVERTKAAGKPVVVSMGDYAASGGYYISAPADWIVAQPTTLTGSIGVFGGKMNLSGTFEKLGLTQHTYKRGEQADLFSATQPFSDAGRLTYRRFLTDFYEIFLERVGDGRSLDRDAAHAVAQGRVWTGAQALERGLVDELGGLDVAIAKAAELGEISGDNVGILRLPAAKTFIELLLEDMSSSASAPQVQLGLGQQLGLGRLDTRALHALAVLDRVMSDGGAVVLLPGNLVIE